MTTIEQPDGSYPRINGELLRTGQYNDMIVSMVGQFDTTRTDPTVPLIYTQFRTYSELHPEALSSSSTTAAVSAIELNNEYATPLSPEHLSTAKEMVFELIGQAQPNNKLVVRLRVCVYESMHMSLTVTKERILCI
jgi:hypothetical protein